MTKPITATTTTPTTTTTYDDAAPRDGEQLGALIFDVRADHLARSGGLWVYPASYSDLRLCQLRAAHLTDTYSTAQHGVVDFFCVYIGATFFIGDGPSPATRSGEGWYPATTIESTPALRRIIRRALARATALRPQRGDAAESEAQP